MNVTPRPTPLRESAAKWSRIVGVAGGLITSLATAGVLTAEQAGALGAGLTSLDVAYAGLVGVITAAVTVLAAFRTAYSGEQKVTPLSAPMNNEGQALVPRVGPPPPRR